MTPTYRARLWRFDGGVAQLVRAVAFFGLAGAAPARFTRAAGARRRLLPAARGGLAMEVSAGLAAFHSRPLDYAFNTLFQIKLPCIWFAVLNTPLLHRSKSWHHAMQCNHADLGLRRACVFS